MTAARRTTYVSLAHAFALVATRIGRMAVARADAAVASVDKKLARVPSNDLPRTLTCLDLRPMNGPPASVNGHLDAPSVVAGEDVSLSSSDPERVPTRAASAHDAG